MVRKTKKSKDIEQDWRLERMQERVLKIMGLLAKLWVEAGKIKSSGKSGQISIDDLARVFEQTVVLFGLASQAFTYKRPHKVARFLLHNPNKRFGSKVERYFDKKAKLKT